MAQANLEYEGVTLEELNQLAEDKRGDGPWPGNYSTTAKPDEEKTDNEEIIIGSTKPPAFPFRQIRKAPATLVRKPRGHVIELQNPFEGIPTRPPLGGAEVRLPVRPEFLTYERILHPHNKHTLRPTPSTPPSTTPIEEEEEEEEVSPAEEPEPNLENEPATFDEPTGPNPYSKYNLRKPQVVQLPIPPDFV